MPKNSLRTETAFAVALSVAALLGVAGEASARAPQDTPPPQGGTPPPEAPPKEGGGEAKPPEKPPEEQKADEIKAFLKQYEEGLSKMTEPEAIAGLDKLKAWYVDPKVAEEQKKSIIKLFSSKVVKVRGKEAYLESAAKVLGDMGGEDCGLLLKFLTNYALEQKLPIQKVVRAGLASLGKIASPKPGDVKFLTDLLKKDDEYIGDVARALQGYAKAPGVIRKDIFEELLKMSEGVFSKQEANDQPAKRRWNIWGTEVVDALKALSRQNFAKPPEFRKWFNNKDEGGGKNPKTWADDGDSGSKK